MALDWNVLGGVGLGIQKGAEELRAQQDAAARKEQAAREKTRFDRETKEYEYQQEVRKANEDLMSKIKGMKEQIGRGEFKDAYGMLQPFINKDLKDMSELPAFEAIAEDGTFDMTDMEGNTRRGKLDASILNDALDAYALYQRQNSGSPEDYWKALEFRIDERRRAEQMAFDREKFAEAVRQFGLENALRQRQLEQTGAYQDGMLGVARNNAATNAKNATTAAQKDSFQVSSDGRLYNTTTNEYVVDGTGEPFRTYIKPPTDNSAQVVNALANILPYLPDDKAEQLIQGAIGSLGIQTPAQQLIELYKQNKAKGAQ